MTDATTPAGAEDEAASAMLHAEQVAPHEVHCGLGSALCSQGRIVRHWDGL